MPEDKSKLSDSALFRQSIGEIKPLVDNNRIKPIKKAPPKAPKVFRDSPHFQTTASPSTYQLVEGTEAISFAQSCVNKKTLKSLKKGHFLIEDSIDLHGLTLVKAQQALTDFLAEQQQFSHRVAIVIHGKGHGSDKQYPVLKNAVAEMLMNNPLVSAYTSAQPKDGGTGAVYVLFK